MSFTKKIAVVTGSRAEYDLLKGLMRLLSADKKVELSVMVTGMHLSPEFGLTYKTIENDGFKIDEKVETLLSSDSPVGIAKSIGLGVIGFAEALNRIQPNLLVILGDRFEIFAAAQAALTHRIPIAHIHGGESTEGLMDEAIRHAITKMSHIHFASTDYYARRIMQLGENPKNVHNVGALGIDNIHNTRLLTQSEFEKSTDFKLGEINFLVTYHPVTLMAGESIKSLMALLESLSNYPNASIIFTQPNADTDGRTLINIIDKFSKQHPQRIAMFDTLGQLRYLSAIHLVDVVIGNSSSGIIEAPSFYTPTVNIGDRQRGRIKPLSVIDCKDDTLSITKAIDTALSKEFITSIATQKSPYGDGNCASKIVNLIHDTDLNQLILKQFHEILDHA